MFHGHRVVCYETATAFDVRGAHVVVAAFKNAKRIADGWDFQSALLERLQISGKELMGKVLVHLDDEYGARTPRTQTDWQAYCAMYVGWKHVFRNYWSESWSSIVGHNHVMNCTTRVPTCQAHAQTGAHSMLQRHANPRVEWAPLGWSSNWRPGVKVRPSSQRSLKIGFYGNEKFQLRPNRGTLMKRFEREAGAVVDGRMLGRVGFGRGNASEYVRLMHDTRLCLQISGLSAECYRMYEALDAGCIPILVNQFGNPSSPNAAVQYQFLLGGARPGPDPPTLRDRSAPGLRPRIPPPFPFADGPGELKQRLGALLSDTGSVDAMQQATLRWWNHSLAHVRGRVIGSAEGVCYDTLADR
jgi:hypothetical protein